MSVTPDRVILFHAGPFAVNAAVVFSWLVIAGLAVLSCALARKPSGGVRMSAAQNLLEVLVSGIERRAGKMIREDPRRYLPFTGSLFLFILASNILVIVPDFREPTGSLSTAAALAACVFLAVPYFGIREQGLRRYLAHYARPTALMLPFNLLGEFSRTMALAVRRFGDIMSGTLAVAILLAAAPLVFPVFTRALGLLTGVMQAYVFAVLALVFVSSASKAHAGVTGPGQWGK